MDRERRREVRRRERLDRAEEAVDVGLLQANERRAGERRDQDRRAQAAGEMERRERVADVVRPQAKEVDHRVGEVQHLPVPERRELRPTGRARGHQHVGVPGARERLDGAPDTRLDLEREASGVAGNGVHRRHAEGRGGDAQRMVGRRRREHRPGTHPAKQRNVRVGRERRAQRCERRGGRQ